jgi:hypothetical protein
MASTTDFESILSLLRMLPPPAVEEVADFAQYLFHKHVRLGVDERIARRKANRWLVERVGNMVMADQPFLTQSGDQLVWRFAAFVTSLSHAPRGPIGYVDVDATTGDVLADDAAVEEMQSRGTSLERPLLSTNG